MDLGTTALFDLPAATSAGQVVETVTARTPVTRSQELLAGIAADRAVIAEHEIAVVRQIAEWAGEHTVSDEADRCTLTERGLDTGLPVAGEGAPLISDFAVMELSALLGRSLDSGRTYVGQVVELSHRLPRTWARVLDGEVPVWKALRIAECTRSLPGEAAGFVDTQLAPFAHGCTWAQIDRLVEEALVRFDPDAAEQKRKDAHEQRHLDIHLHHTGFDGVVHLDGVLDAADARDLEQAISRRAKALGQLGRPESLDVRRSIAAGELARHDLALDLQIADPKTGQITHTVPGRKVELVVHLTDTALTGVSTGSTTAVARCGTTRTPISPQQIKDWLATPGTTVTVRPVIDLNNCRPVDSYEIPDRLRRQVTLRDHHCVYPYCTRRVETCDCDHIQPHGQGGITCSCNLAPLCRGHHRFKTTDRATYRMLEPGTYQWTINNRQWIVDPHGTRLLPPDPPDE